jgi:hypothetical protein
MVTSAKHMLFAEKSEPSMIVAHSMHDGPPPLGLDRPLPLWTAGSGRLCPSGIPAALGIDHVVGLRTFLASACMQQATEGLEWYRQPPLALLGMRGVGKGFAAHWIARQAGLPLFRMPPPNGRAENCEQDDLTLRTTLPLPVIAMASARCANPVIVIELDVDEPISLEVEASIVSMIDPRSNSRWIDPDHEAIFDLSCISWIIEVQGRNPGRGVVRDHNEPPWQPAALPVRLAALIEDAGKVLQLDAPHEREALRRLDVAVEVCAASAPTASPETVERVHDALMDLHRSRVDHLPCTDLVRQARHSLALLQTGRPG